MSAASSSAFSSHSPLYLYDSRKKGKVPFTPLKKNEVSFYSCGPTVYNKVHIGNLRAFLFADTLQRYWKFGKNMKVKWVMNITDVDDKTIRDSQLAFPEYSPQKALSLLTKKYSTLFFQDLKKLNINKSDFFKTPRATDYISEMKDLVQKIVDNGFGYEKNGSVYFDVQKYCQIHNYGHLVNIDFEKMQSTARIEKDEYEKDSASDFVLWKAKKETNGVSEPFWDFELSLQNGETVLLDGRPGWHLECSAMEKKILGLPFDIHSGGVDLCFPHHEDEIAQSVAGYGQDPNVYWVHNEHLMVDGKKMSKSLGNFYTLDDLEEKGFSLDGLRFFLVTNHYRTKVNLSDESLLAAENLLKRIRNFCREIKKNKKKSECSGVATADMQNFQKKFFAAMDDDMNVSVAIAEFFRFLKNVFDKGFSGSSTKVFSRFVNIVERVELILGVSFFPEDLDIPEEILLLSEKRKEVRAEKDWAESDVLRDKIVSLGYEIRDKKGENGEFYVIVKI